VPDKSKAMTIESVEVLDPNGTPCDELPFLSPCTIRIVFDCPHSIPQPLFNVRFYDGEKHIFEASMLIDGPGPETVEGRGVVECHIPTSSNGG
jgi:hypothetical protein